MISPLASIDALAGSGKVVISGGDDAIVELVKAAIGGKSSLAFYLTRAQADAVKAWFWTPERIESNGVEKISEDEGRRIESELGLRLGEFHFAPIQCGTCSRTYGAFEFFRQGIEEHGPEALRSILSMENAVLLQVNPKHMPVCPECQTPLRATGEAEPKGFYFGSGYAACTI